MEWRPYVPVAVRHARARREMDRLRKKGKSIQPVEIEGRTIARSFWGKRWCDHLESFSDYANRLPRGRTYVRNGSVCHLEIHPGRIGAIVMGSELYDVTIRIGKLKAAVWKSIKHRCSGQIGSVLELLQGKLSKQVMGVVTDRQHGLFPKPGEIRFDCSCPDWAAMCKHIASVLYGVGSRLDDRPESLFLLRGVDTAELIATGMALPGDTATDDALADDALAGIFGIDLDTGDAPPPAPKAPAKPRRPAHRRAASAPGRQASPAAKARDVAASAGNARKAASSVTREAKTSPATTARKRTAAKAQDVPASAASTGRARKTASSVTRGTKTSPAATVRKRASAKAQDLPASTASAGRARKTASSIARGTKTSPAATARKRAVAKAQDLPASKASAGRARKTASSVTRGTNTPPTATPGKRAAARKAADASPSDIRPTGKWVARLRRRCGLTVAEFAARLGVSTVTVYRWEATPGRLNLHARPLNALTSLYRRSGKPAR